MKKYLTILLFIGCTQKQPEQPLAASYTTYVSSATFSTLKVQFDSLSVNYKRDTTSKGQRIRQLESNQQVIFTNISELFKRTDDLQRSNWKQDSAILITTTISSDPTFIKIIKDSLNNIILIRP